MTTSTTPPSTTIRINEPGELIASVPGLLGFPPTRSLVVLCLHGPSAVRVGLAVRIDLPDPRRIDPRGVAAMAEQISVLCARQQAGAVTVIVVEDRTAGLALPHRGLLAAVRHGCEEVGIEVRAAHTVERIVAGAVWHAYDQIGAASGRLPDPQASVVSAEHVVRGRTIYGDRTELAELVRRDADSLRYVGLLDAALDTALLAREMSGERALRADLEAVLTAVAQVGNEETLLPEQVARLGAALADPLVRDGCFGLAVGEHADDAQSLWLQLCRALPDPERAEAAVLVAYSCYVRGEGPLAGIALRAALDSVPGHRMASLLDTALSAGLPPEAVRELADTSWTIAAELGVPLAPFSSHPRAAE